MELPLALPSIVAGIRVAAVIGVGTATIAAAVGAGGLGEYIFRGLSMVEPTVILAGAVPAALPGADWWTAACCWPSAPSRADATGVARAAALAAALALVVLAAGGRRGRSRGTRGRSIRVGSKNFTEQIILGEIARADDRARRAASRSSGG